MADIYSEDAFLLIQAALTQAYVFRVATDGVLVDPSAAVVTILDADGAILETHTLGALGSALTKVTTGVYQLVFTNAVNRDQGDYLMQVSVTVATVQTDVIVLLKVTGLRTFAVLPYFRLEIDKTRKTIEPELGVYTGYTDLNLVMYLEQGAQILNMYGQDQFCYTVETFPMEGYRSLLLLAGLFAGLLSQTVYSIDTDPQFSDQGYTFPLDRFPKLKQVMDGLMVNIEKQVNLFKLIHVRTGSIHTEIGPSWKLNQLLQAAPTGAIFRNVFVSGG